ncbi:MAG: glycoside hydrolase family 43 protein [Bacteroidota bacterium]|nr:glycoside hydrolase family 43 protein [Bacteroidota bacterium]
MKRNLFKKILLLSVLLAYINSQAQQFSNPLLPSGADPFSFYKDGYYYYTHTTGKNITVWKSKNIAGLRNAEKKIVFVPPASGPFSKQIWAPEIHFIHNKWYIYFAADSGSNDSHRLWVLENASPDPLQGKWVLKGKLTTPGDKWSIDGSVFSLHNQLYCIWSGWEKDQNGQQNIYIARMRNPWTITGERSCISSPTLEWEMHGDLKNPNDPPHVNVNEGPEILLHGDKVFLVYSASGCWTEYYALGMLTASSYADLMNPASWKKSPEPVFKASLENSVYAPGHNSFFTSPDGKENWILYHANSKPGQGCGGFRSPRAQKFSWTKEGFPDFGIPVREGVLLASPSE